MTFLRKNRKFIYLSIISFIFLTSCATQKSSSKIDLAQNVETIYNIEGKIAVFPVFIAERCRFIPRIGNFALTAGEEISIALDNSSPKLEVINTIQTGSIIEENGLSEDLYNIEQQYRKTGKIDLNLIAGIVKAFDMQYFLFSSIDSLVGTENIAYKPQADIKMTANIYKLNSAEIIRKVSVKKAEVVVIVAASYPYESVTVRASYDLVNALFASSSPKKISKISFGLLSGINYAMVHSGDSFFKPNTEAGFFLTGFGQLQLGGNYYIQTQIQYLTRSLTFKPIKTSREITKWSYDFVDIPIFLMIKPQLLPNKIAHYIQVGPSFGFNWNHSASVELNSRTQFSSKENRIKPVIDFALVFGSGFEFNFYRNVKFIAGAQYFWSINSMYKYDTWKFRTIKIMAGFIYDI